jgi:hypothetical protein
MADLAKVKRNVSKMVGMNAPEADIDAYIASEGVTVDDVRNFTGDAAAPTVNMSVTDAFARKQKTPPPKPNLMDSTLATVGGLTSSVPFLNNVSDAILAGGQSIGDAVTGQPVNFNERFTGIQNRRQQMAQAAPLANMAGNVAGTVMGSAALGGTKLGADALGMVGKGVAPFLKAAGSTAAYEGLQGISEGQSGGELLGRMGVGAGAGGFGNLIGQGINKAGQVIADKFTRGAQNTLTDAAIKNAPSADDLFKSGSDLFEQATGGKPLQVTEGAYFRMLGDVQEAVKRFRPNELNNKEAVGILQKLWSVGDDLSAGTGVAVDFKDLHILRRAASAVTQGTADDETKAIARLIINKMDDFIGGLRPGDIAGGADPKAAGNALLTGISTWSKASKVAMIEDAITAADAYKSGTEMGLKAAFTRLMKSGDFGRFTKIEQDAIREVAKGTSAQNALALLGRAGFSLGGGGGHNVIGGFGSLALGTTALAPVFGPLAPVVAGAASMGGAAAGRAGADRIATNSAQRAARIMATTGIPMARQAPNLLAPVALPADLLTRAGGQQINR